jgi:hypothetical protein
MTWISERVGEKNEAILTYQIAPKRFAKRTLDERYPFIHADEKAEMSLGSAG